MSPLAGEFVTETFDYDGGRDVTVYVPPNSPEAVVFAGDGQLISQWGRDLEGTAAPPTMIVGPHRLDDETLRLQEYVYNTDFDWADPKRFAAHERFFVEDVRRWARSRFGLALPAERTAVCGLSASWRTLASNGSPASGPVRCGLLRLAGRRLPAACGDAEPTAAHLPRRRHAGTVFWPERQPVGARATRCWCGRRDN